MKKQKPPITKYPGNKWFARQVERSGSDSSIPFIHGVVRGALANPMAIDPGAALEEVLMDAEMIDFPQEEFRQTQLRFPDPVERHGQVPVVFPAVSAGLFRPISGQKRVDFISFRKRQTSWKDSSGDLI